MSFFNEEIDKRLWRTSVEATKTADVFIVVGSTMLVYPAADLLKMISPDCELYVIDPEKVPPPEDCNRKFIYIRSGASLGLQQLKATLKLK